MLVSTVIIKRKKNVCIANRSPVALTQYVSKSELYFSYSRKIGALSVREAHHLKGSFSAASQSVREVPFPGTAVVPEPRASRLLPSTRIYSSDRKLQRHEPWCGLYVDALRRVSRRSSHTQRGGSDLCCASPENRAPSVACAGKRKSCKQMGGAPWCHVRGRCL